MLPTILQYILTYTSFTNYYVCKYSNVVLHIYTYTALVNRILLITMPPILYQLLLFILPIHLQHIFLCFNAYTTLFAYTYSHSIFNINKYMICIPIYFDIHPDIPCSCLNLNYMYMHLIKYFTRVKKKYTQC